MEYLTIKETSEKWGMSDRRLRTLCAENRIPGVITIGRGRRIPADAVQPKDERIKSGKYINLDKNLKLYKDTMLINNIHEGDCLIKMKDIPDQSIDLILCDLPYAPARDKLWESYIDLDMLWVEYKRIIKPSGTIALMGTEMFTARIILSNPTWFAYKWVWEKSRATNIGNPNTQPLRAHEDICIFYKKNTKPTYNPQMSKNSFNGGSKYPRDVIYFESAEIKGIEDHPMSKPFDLAEYLVKTYTNPGDVVLDNACGSGVFLAAALANGRNFIGIELNSKVKNYFKKVGYVDYVDYVDSIKRYLYKNWKKLLTTEKETLTKSTLLSEFESDPGNFARYGSMAWLKRTPLNSIITLYNDSISLPDKKL